MKTLNKQISLLVSFLLLPLLFSATSGTQDLTKPRIQIALLLDTSNSMDGLIDQTKSQLWTIINTFATARKKSDEAQLEFALYEYGNDGLSSQNGFTRQVVPMTTDLDQLSESLFGLRTNGGSEYCGKVINTAITDLAWSDNKDDLKIIFIAGNEGFNQGETSFQSACRLAKNKNIFVNTVFCGDYQAGINSFWKEGALLASGNYSNINQNQVTTYINTPYDNEILKLNDDLNNTYIYYNEEGKELQKRMVLQDNNAAKGSKSNKVQRSFYKSSKKYKSPKKWDVVDTYQEEPEAIEELEEEEFEAMELPTQYDSLSKVEFQQVVIEKSEDRTKIQNEINELKVKRENYITSQNNTKNNNGLESVIITSLKNQATSKGFKIK